MMNKTILVIMIMAILFWLSNMTYSALAAAVTCWVLTVGSILIDYAKSDKG